MPGLVPDRVELYKKSTKLYLYRKLEATTSTTTDDLVVAAAATTTATSAVEEDVSGATATSTLTPTTVFIGPTTQTIEKADKKLGEEEA